MLKRYALVEGKLQETESESAPVAVFTNPDEAEKRLLVSLEGIDEHTLGSALDPEELSRLEFEPDHVALIFKRPKNYSGKDQLLFKVASMGLFLYKEKLTIVISEDVPLFVGKPFTNVRALDEVFLKLLYNSIYHYMEHLRVITMISDEIERKLNVSMENKYLLNLFSLEKSLVYYVNAINSNGFTFEKLRNNSARLGLSEKSLELLDDIIVENGQCQRQAEIYSNILASLMDARASIVNNNLNILMKQLTVISVVFMPLNVIAGIFGMSEFTTMTQGIDWRISYTIFTLAMVVIGVITYYMLGRIISSNRRT